MSREKGRSTRIVLVTCPSLALARKIARAVVEQRLAACVNVVRSPVESFYTWKGKLESAREHLLLIKTTAQRLSSLEREVKRLHPYDLPEFIAIPISEGSTEYLAWLGETIGALRESRAGNRGAQPRIERSVLKRRLRTD